MFKIIKKTSAVWQHELNGQIIHLSSFGVVADISLQTFILRALNGSYFPQQSVGIADIIVIDETDGSVEESFGTINELLNRLVVLNYTPYISQGGGGGSQNLQQVTDNGATTTNAIETGNLTIDEVNGGDPCITTNQSLTDGFIISQHQDTDSNFAISVRFPATITGNQIVDYPDGSGTIATQEWIGSQLDSKQDDLVSGTNIKTIEGQSLLGSGNIDLSKSDVGLGNVDNTSDLNKPISTATQTALNLKSNLATTPRLLANDESGITSTGTETVCATIQIDNLGTNWAIDVFLDAIKSGTTSGTQARLYLNDTANLTGTPTQLALSQSNTNTVRVTPLLRKLSYKSGILKVANSTTTLQNDLANQTGAKTEITIDLNTATTRYLVLTVQRFSTAGDTVTAGRHQVVFNPNV